MSVDEPDELGRGDTRISHHHRSPTSLGGKHYKVTGGRVKGLIAALIRGYWVMGGVGSCLSGTLGTEDFGETTRSVRGQAGGRAEHVEGAEQP
jgi:hypothetical protein